MQLLTHYIVIGIVFLILVFSIFLSYLVYWDSDVKIESFDTRPQPEDVQSDRCDPSTIDNICQNSKACCTISNNAYFCRHPLVKNCTTELQNCLDKTDFDALYPVELRMEKCKNQLTDCCKPFEKIPKDMTKFENIGPLSQKVDIIGDYIALDANQREICPKLCKTDDKCAAFSMDLGGCKFYGSVNPILPAKSKFAPKLKIDTTNKSGYFKKK